MCGIAGLLGPSAGDGELLRHMAETVSHRGPDDSGVWSDPEAGIGLSHRRLSIVDLSPEGHQPMVSSDGRLVLSYNGEIYNHSALRRKLEAVGAQPSGGWRGHSDTETLLQAISAWGLTEALEQSVGMFAFALWDRHERSLNLVRDRFGEKPLYYGWAGKDFLFGSELKAIRAHPRFDGEIDRQSLGDYLERSHVPAPRSIYRGIFKLSPGCVLTATLAAARSRRIQPLAEEGEEGGIKLSRYWDYRNVFEAGLANAITDEAEALNALDDALGQAVQGQSVADVPVGAFLSGGIDSSTIVALARKHSSKPVRTFSIGFEEADYDEAKCAKVIAAHFGTIHHELYVSARDARNVISLLPHMYDEPFGDSSQIPTYLVSRFARNEVTVAITGDGGDELFGGYNRHTVAPAIWQRACRVPQPLRSLAAKSAALIPNVLIGIRGPNFADKVQRGARLVGDARSFRDIYAGLRNDWHGRLSPLLGATGQLSSYDLDVDGHDAGRAMYCDAVSYLPDDILCKVDRASMAVSLETRVPFLDHRVAALAARIPLSLKVKEGQGKYLLRQLLYQEAPRSLFDRPKAGFAVPVGKWLKDPLRDWAEDLLDPAKMAGEGWLDHNIVKRRWHDHLAGRGNSTQAIWSILMFQAWLRAS